MATFAGEVEVTVVPDTSKFGTELEGKATAAAAKAAERIGKAMGQIIADRVANGVRQGIDRAGTGAAGTRAGNEFGRAFARTANATIKAGLKDQKVGVSFDVNQKGLTQVRTQLRSLRDKELRVGVNVTGALANLDRLKVKLAEVGALRPTVRFDADTAAASAQIAALHRQITGLPSRHTTHVGVTGTDGARAGMHGLLAVIAALGPALVPVGAAGVAALAGIGAAAVAAASGVGVLALALAPVIGAYQALGKAQERSGAAAATGASRAIALANAQDSLKQAVQGVARVKRDAAQAAEDADRRIADAERDVEEAVRASIRTQNDGAQRVADAKRRLADAARRAADVQVQADRRIQDAEQSLADAQQDVLRAQERLNEARGLAARDAEDLESRAANGRLDERDAVLDLADAEAELASASAEDRERAQLAFDRSRQRLEDIRRENARLAQEQAEAARQGIEGSDRVTSAREALAEAERRAAEAARNAAEAAQEAARDREDAARGVADAEQAVAEAVEDAAERQRQAALKVADARRDLQEAVKAEQDQAVKSAEAIAAAQQQVVQAQRGVQSATISAGQAGGAAMDDARKKLAALTPEGRAFVLFLRDEFVPAVRGLSGEAQAGLLPGLQDGMRSLIPLMPVFRELVGSVAEVMGTLFREAGRALQGPFWTEFFDFLNATAAPTLLTMGRTLGQVAKGFAGLGIAFQPLADQFGAGLLKLATRFADFAAGATENPAFQEFLAYVIKAGPVVVSTLGSLFRAIGNIAKALAPLGLVIVKVIGWFGDFIAALPEPVLAGLVVGIGLIAAAFTLLPVVISVVSAVMGAYALVTGTATVASLGLTAALGPIIAIIAAVVVAVIALGVAVYEAYQHWEPFRVAVDTTWAAIKAATAAAWNEVLKPTLEALWGFIKNTLIPIFVWLWQNAVVPAWQGISAAIQVAWAVIKTVFEAIWGFIRDVLIPAFRTYLLPVIQFVWNLIKVAIEVAWVAIQIIWKAIEIFIRAVLAPVFRWLYENVIKPVWDDISTIIRVTWETLIKPVFKALGDFISTSVAPAFSAGVAAIKAAWESIVEVAKVPVRFVVEQVINKGIIGTFNTVAKAFGVSPVKEIVLPDFFAQKPAGAGSGPAARGGGRMMLAAGGEVPATLGTPGVDSVPALLMPNEHVWTTAEVSGAGGHAAVARLRALAAAGMLRGYAAGGPVVPSFLGNPAAFLRDKASGLIDRIAEFGDNAFIQLLTAVPKKLMSMALERVAGMFGLGDAGVPGGVGWQHQWALVKAQFPGAVLTSAYRPGSITSSGNPSYHSMGRAIDVSPDMRIFNWIAENFGAATKELIFTPAGSRQIKDGRQYLYGGQVAQDHWDHVHWAFDQGGYLPPGLSTVFNGTGKPEPVFTDAQWRMLSERGAATPSISADVKVYNPIPETASESTTRVMRRLAAVGPRG